MQQHTWRDSQYVGALLKAWEVLGENSVGRTSSRGMSPGVRNSSATFGMPSAALHSDDSLSFRMGLRLACRVIRHHASG